MIRIPWTHFHPASKTLFDVDTCERCGRVTQAANSVTGGDPVTKYRRMGVKIVKELPPEAWWDDEFDGVTCDRQDCATYNCPHCGREGMADGCTSGDCPSNSKETEDIADWDEEKWHKAPEPVESPVICQQCGRAGHESMECGMFPHPEEV